MSVAFRHDGDEEHLEPKFEKPIPPGQNLVTLRGKSLIDDNVCKYTALLTSSQDETEIAFAKRDLRYWKARQSTAEVMPCPTADAVAFGTIVTFTLNGKERTLSIVGSDEAYTASDLLSFTAPLARALMGAEPGDLLPFGGKEDGIEVISITALEPAQSFP